MAIVDGRQWSPTTDGIRADHLQRYAYAAALVDSGESKYRPVVDFGCGCGYGSAILAARTGGTVFGMDSDRKAVAYAIEHYASPRNWWRVSDRLYSEEHWFPSRASLVALEVIEHLENAGSFLDQARECCNFLVGSVPNEEVVPFDPARNERHFRHYTLAELTGLLGDTGWRIDFLGGQMGKTGSEAVVGRSLSNDQIRTCRTLFFSAVPEL